MTEEEWAIVNGLVNYCRNNGITWVEADHPYFNVHVKLDDGGFELVIDRENLNGG